MATVTKPIALDESFNTTEVTPRNIADVLAEGLSHITGRTASEVEYDNTESELTADNVQDAIDEVNGKVPTLPTTDIQTAVDEFSTYNGGLLSECIIELVPVQSGSGDPSPDNVRPISGHTQVDVDVSDGDTTQEQVTVNLGGTYYSGTLDVVTGVFTPDTAGVEYDGSDDEAWTKASDTRFAIAKPADVSANPDGAISNEFVYGGTSGISILDGQFSIGGLNISARHDAITTLADWKTFLSNNPMTIVYPLATPTPIQLSPTTVKALVGENHLSAPLEGQEITESKYRELFTWDEVEAYVNAHSSGGSGMNYSTNEQVVGTWINSKPLYQKTITHSGALTVDNTFSNDIGTLANVDQFVKCEGYFRRTDANGLMYSLNGGTRPEDGADSYKVTTRFFDGQVQVAVKGYNDIEYIALTVQYTKTTD